MYARLFAKPLSPLRVLSWIAQVCGAILFVGWISFVATEQFGNHFKMPDVKAVFQAVAIALIFGAYVYSRKHLLVGSLLGILATGCFIVVARATTGVWPPLGAALFAVPGLLTLGLWFYAGRRQLRRRRI